MLSAKSAKFLYRKVPEVKLILTREIHRNYYDLLGISPKANQADIKRAYYEKSMLYHPDKSLGNADIFRDLTAAYEILSNIKLRKIYDKEMSATARPKAQKQYQQQSTHTDFKRPSKGQQDRVYENINENSETYKKRQTYTGKTEHFDYDAWTQAHYTETFAKRENAKRRMRDREIDLETLNKIDAVAFVLVVVFIVSSSIFMSRMKDHDTVDFRRSKE